LTGAFPLAAAEEDMIDEENEQHREIGAALV